MLLALAPYSDIGYNIELSSELDGLGQVQSLDRGSGGYYRLQWGNGFAYDNRLRGGINLSYIFGRTNSQQGVQPSDIDAAALIQTDALRARGLEVQLGAQYDFSLGQTEAGRSRKLTVGASYTIGAELNGEASRFATATSFLRLVDTVTFETDLDQSVTLPDRLGVGAYYSNAGRFGVGLDVTPHGLVGVPQQPRARSAPRRRRRGSAGGGVRARPEGLRPVLATRSLPRRRLPQRRPPPRRRRGDGYQFRGRTTGGTTARGGVVR